MGNQPPPPPGPPPPPPGPPPGPPSGPAGGQPPAQPTEPIQPAQPTQQYPPAQPPVAQPAYGPPAGPQPPKKGIPSWALAVGGGLLAAIAVVAVILLTRGGDEKAVDVPTGQTTVAPTVTVSVSPPPVTPTATTSPTSTGPLTAEEQELLALIPEGHRGTCVQTEDQVYPAGFAAKLGCTDEDNALFVTYALFRDAAAMNAAFEEQASGFPEANCADTAEARGTYTIDGAPAGQLLCYQAAPSTDPSGAEWAWVIWTDDQLLVFAFGARYDGNAQAMYTWWIEKSGPIHS